jgi:hypothetical protein
LGSGLDVELESDWGGVTPACAKVWEVGNGVGGTSAIVGVCGAGMTVAGAGIMTVGIGGLENVKGRALIGGSSRLDGTSGA